MYPADGRPASSVPGSAKLVPSGEPPVGPVLRPSSTPAWAQKPLSSSPTARKDNSEVEAERLWWSDACERQVKELQSAFSTEFNRLAERLSSDLGACELKLQKLVENEKNERNATLSEIRREADSHGTELEEVIRSQKDFKDQLTSLQASLFLRSGADAELAQLQREVKETRELVVGLQSRPGGGSPSEGSPAGLKVQQMEASLADLRRDVVGCVDSQEQVEKLIQSLQRDVAEVHEKVHIQSVASEEQRSLHQVISKSAGELGRGIEEVSSAVIQNESNLRQEIQKADLQLRAELLEELDRRYKQLAQGLTDERDSRLRESGMVKTRVDTVHGRLDQLERHSTSQELGSVQSQLEETQNEVMKLMTAHGQLQAECKRSMATSPTSTLNQDAGSQQVSDAELRLRVETLEAKVESQVPRAMQLEAQVKEVRANMTPLGSRVQAIEAELRKSSWEMAPLTARLDSAEAEIARLSRDNNMVEGLNADVEVLKRRYLQAQPSADRRLAGRPAIPQDLRNNISSLVKKVNETVSQTLPGDVEGTQATIASDSTVSAPSAGARSGEELPEQLAQLLQAEGTNLQEYKVLAAIQELRERNLELREKNAELAQDIYATPWPHQGEQMAYRPPEHAVPVAEIRGATVQVQVSARGDAGPGSVLLPPPSGGTVLGPGPGPPPAMGGSMLIPRGSLQIGPGTGEGPVPGRITSPERRRSGSKEAPRGSDAGTPTAIFRSVRVASPERRTMSVMVPGVPPGVVAVPAMPGVQGVPGGWYVKPS